MAPFLCLLSGIVTQGAGFDALFPGLDLRMMSIDVNTMLPAFREVNKRFGVCKVTWTACNAVLERGSGSGTLIVPGGAQEAVVAYPNTMNLKILRRRGFLKVALRQGASLVPVLSFGENDVYRLMHVEEGSLLWNLQCALQQMFGFTVPHFWGRTILGVPTIMPLRRDINIVVGRPIPVAKFDGDLRSPEGKRVLEELFATYTRELQSLFEAHKGNYPPCTMTIM